MSDIKVARGNGRTRVVTPPPAQPAEERDDYDPVMRVFMYLRDGTVEQRVGTTSQMTKNWLEHSIGAVLEVTTNRKLHRKRSSPTDVFCVSSPDQVAGQLQSPYEYHVGPAGELTITAGDKMVVVYAPGAWLEIEPSRLTGPADVAADTRDVDVELHTTAG